MKDTSQPYNVLNLSREGPEYFKNDQGSTEKENRTGMGLGRAKD
jgi:hypothetical protein